MEIDITHSLSVEGSNDRIDIGLLTTGHNVVTLRMPPEVFRDIVWSAMALGIITREQIGLTTGKIAAGRTIVR